MKQLQPEVAEAQSHAEVASTKCKTPMTQVHEESVSHSDDGEQHEAVSVPAASATIVEQLQVDVAKAHSRAEHAERHVSEMSAQIARMPWLSDLCVAFPQTSSSIMSPKRCSAVKKRGVLKERGPPCTPEKGRLCS